MWNSHPIQLNGMVHERINPDHFVLMFQSQAADVDLPSYGHQQVDRFAVLLDLWANETAFLESKRQVCSKFPFFCRFSLNIVLKGVGFTNSLCSLVYQ